MRHALLPALLAAVLPAPPARAQEAADPSGMVSAGVLADGPSVTEDESRSRCLPLGP